LPLPTEVSVARLSLLMLLQFVVPRRGDEFFKALGHVQRLFGLLAFALAAVFGISSFVNDLMKCCLPVLSVTLLVFDRRWQVGEELNIYLRGVGVEDFTLSLHLHHELPIAALALLALDVVAV